jgi:hypothetical protein
MRNISEYFKQEEDIYVLNTTKPLGIISVAFGEKGDIHETIPKTTIPFRLTDRIPKEQVVKSIAFRSIVQKGFLTLLTEAEYRKMITPTKERIVSEERERLANKQTLPPDLSTDVSEGKSSVEPEINPRVIQLMHFHNIEEHGEMGGAIPSENAIVDELSILDISEDDLAYIMTHSHGQVKDWAMDKVKEPNHQTASSAEIATAESKRIKRRRRVTPDGA